jgi:peptidoglycan/xylan/chitin deacetylase (PgdA/CDA1 family)
MSRKLKRLAADLAAKVTWEVFSQRREPSPKIAILCYHRVLPELVEDAEDPVYTVLPEQFEAQLDFLVKAGFRSLSLEEFGEMALGLKPCTKRAVVITFDDGYADNYALAWPLCRKYGIRLNLFLATGAIGLSQPMVMTKQGYRFLNNESDSEKSSGYFQAHIRKFPHLWRPLNWQEIEEMYQAGVSLGLHGHSHHNLACLSPDEITKEIAASLGTFQRELGVRPRFMALPYGGYESNTPEIVALLQQFGLRFVFTTIPGRASVPSRSPLFPRLLIYQHDGLEVFRRKLFGAYDWLERLKRFLRKT